jgi:hypothetical protein
MKKFRNLSEELTPSSKPEPGREAIGGRFSSSSPKRPTKPAPIVTSEENISEIVMPQVKGDLGALDKTSFVKKHGISKSAAKQKLATEAKDEEEYGYEGDMAMNQLKTIVRHSEYLMDMMKPDTDLPEWVQSKITLATDYIQTACDYMTSEMSEAKEMGDDPTGDVSQPNLTVKKGKTTASGPVTEATSAAIRLQRALQREKEKREREERAGAALLKPKQPVKEDVMQEREDDEYHTPTRHHVQVQVSKGDGPKQHRKATVRAKEPKHAVSAAIAHYKQQGYTVHDHKYLGENVEQLHEWGTEIKQHNDKVFHVTNKRTGNHIGTIVTPKATNPKYRATVHRGHGAGGDLHTKEFDSAKEARKHIETSHGITEEVVQIEEGRPSQRHPLEGHEYHKKSDEALIHIAKDAHAAAEAMKGHNTTAENKYRDQANDSATVRHFRKTSGMPDWYKKKYGHMKESFRPMDEPNYNNSIQARQKKADDANKPPFDGPYKKSTGIVTDKSGAKHGGMSIARHIAREAMKKQASKMSVKESLEESRKAEIVKEIMKKGKKKEDNTFQGEPELGSTVVKADN